MVVERDANSVKVWWRGWRITFFPEGDHPEVVRESPPDSDPGGSQDGIKSGTMRNGLKSLRFGDWIVQLSPKGDEAFTVFEAVPKSQSGTAVKMFRKHPR